MRKVVVTGGLGFVGAQVFRQLSRSGAVGEVVILDAMTRAADFRRLAPAGQAADVPVIRGDIRSKRDVAAALQDCDAVVHLAAQTSTDKSHADRKRTFDVNVTGTETLLSVALDQGVKHFIHVSSGKVYGPAREPQVETAALKPVTAYAVSKVMAEEAVMLAAQSGLRSTILRPARTIGSGQTMEHPLPRLVMKVLKGQHLPISGAGTRKTEFLPVRDLAAAIGLAVTGNRAEEALSVFNVPGEERLCALEIARRVFQAAGRTTGLHYVRDCISEQDGCFLDGGRLRALGYRQQSSVDTELRAICDGFVARARRMQVSP